MNIHTKILPPLPSAALPDGRRIYLADLPPAGFTRRWTIAKKAAVACAVRGGLLTHEEACKRYMLSVDELLSWQRAIERHGVPGLRATKIQEYAR
jgi:hypothetical protein